MPGKEKGCVWGCAAADAKCQQRQLEPGRWKSPISIYEWSNSHIHERKKQQQKSLSDQNLGPLPSLTSHILFWDLPSPTNFLPKSQQSHCRVETAPPNSTSNELEELANRRNHFFQTIDSNPFNLFYSLSWARYHFNWCKVRPILLIDRSITPYLYTLLT